jgi:hypothetical protein
MTTRTDQLTRARNYATNASAYGETRTPHADHTANEQHEQIAEAVNISRLTQICLAVVSHRGVSRLDSGL